MNDPAARLERLLGGPALAALRRRLRRHFELELEPGDRLFLHLGNLRPAEREALALLTGRPARNARSMRLEIAVADEVLRTAGIARDLRDALEQLDGPIVARAAERAAATLAWSDLRVRPGRDCRLEAWLRTTAGANSLKRVARQNAKNGATLLDQADAVLRHLSAAGMPRAQLAASVLGSAHALDAGQPVAALVLGVLRHHASDAAEEPPATAAAGTSEERARDVWARAGVLVNELARPALVLNLPTRARVLGMSGEPAYLSLRQLVRSPPDWAVDGLPVHVCENPNLLAIVADVLGARSAPLVCTDGMPAAAQRTLLSQLAEAGARLRYHGDFDWAGLQIANYVIANWRATPWRMGAADYEDAVRQAPRRPRDLKASAVVATWDAELAAAMARHGLAIAEEALADGLTSDLRATN